MQCRELNFKTTKINRLNLKNENNQVRLFVNDLFKLLAKVFLQKSRAKKGWKLIKFTANVQTWRRNCLKSESLCKIYLIWLYLLLLVPEWLLNRRWWCCERIEEFNVFTCFILEPQTFNIYTTCKFGVIEESRYRPLKV